MKKSHIDSQQFKIRTLLLILSLFYFNYSSFGQSEIISIDSFTIIEHPEVSWVKAIVQDLTADGDYRRQKRAIKKFFKNANNQDLEDYMYKLEHDGQDRETILRHFPFVYYVLFNAWYRCVSQKHHDPDIAYRYATIAKTYGSKNTFTTEDAVLVRKVIKFARRYNSLCFPKQQVKSANDLVGYMERESNNYIIEKKNKAKAPENRSKEIKKKLEPLERKSAQLAAEIKDLEALADNKRAEIRNLTMANYKDALREVNELVKRKIIEKGEGIVDTTLSGGVRFITSKETSSDPVSSAVYNSGFKKSTFCTPEIQSATRDIVSTILDIANFKEKMIGIPPDYLQKILFDVTITGKADGERVIRKNGICTLKYTDKTPIKGVYYLGGDIEFKNPISVDIEPGGAICDEELAYLRADCAYMELEKILKEKGLPKKNIQPKIIVRVYDEKGPDYRGVDLEFNVDNMFIFLKNDIDKKYEEKQKVDEKIKDLKRQLEANDAEIKAINEPWIKQDKEVKEALAKIEYYKTH